MKMPCRFGMFIHFGIYSIPAYHEQVRWRKHMSREEYSEYAKIFNPSEFDADAIVKLAADAGMEYICFTTKHHDGFCMWDTQQTDFKITNTPYGKDILRQLADACERGGIKLSLYYSNPDWNHPNSYNPASSHQIAPEPSDNPDIQAYVRYIKEQLKELLTGYGKIYTLFWDILPRLYDPSINEYVRSLQPGILINDRGWDEGDFSTPERQVPDGQAFDRYTEACQSVGRQSWGYREGEDYYSNLLLTRSIDKIMCMDGSYLLNVGPMASGALCDTSVKKIKAVGDWYNRVREAFDGTQPVPSVFDDKTLIVTKRDENTFYLHLYGEQDVSGLHLSPFDRPLKRAVLLNDGRELRSAVIDLPENLLDWDKQILKPAATHIFDLPCDEFSNEVMVIRIEL